MSKRSLSAPGLRVHGLLPPERSPMHRGTSSDFNVSQNQEGDPKQLSGVNATLSEPGWPPYHHDSFAQAASASGARCSFESKQVRLLNESQRGTYVGKDPRQLLADGVFDGYYNPNMYHAPVGAFSNGLLRSSGREAAFSGGGSDNDRLITTGAARVARQRALAASYHINFARPKRTSGFASRTSRLTPTRSYYFHDARIRTAEDPFGGIQPFKYQGRGGYYPVPEKKFSLETSTTDAEGKPKSIEQQVKETIAAARIIAKTIKETHDAEQYGSPPNSFHDSNDHFRYGTVVKQPSRPSASFVSTARSSGAKHLEPHHRERPNLPLRLRIERGEL